MTKKQDRKQRMAKIMWELQQPHLATQEKDKLSDEYRKLINKNIRNYCKKSKR